MAKKMKPNLNDYSVLSHDEKAFVVRHPDGSAFRVAKDKLDKATQDRIQKFADGGGVQPADFVPGQDYANAPLPGDAVNEDQGVSTSLPSYPDAPSAAQQLEAINNSLAITHSTDSSQPTISAMLAGPFSLPSEAQNASNDAISQVAHGGGAGENSGGINPENPIPPHELMARQGMAAVNPASDYDRAFGQMESGIKGQAAAQAKLANAQAQIQGALVQQLQKAQADAAARRQSLDARSEELFKAMTQDKVDPNHFWANKSEGNKTMALIAIALGGIGAQLNGTQGNPALDMINKAIDRDIDAQKANLDHKKSLFRANLEMTKNADDAAALTQSQMLTTVQAQLAKAAAMSASPEAFARAQQMIGELGLKKAELHNTLAQRGFINQLASGQGGYINPESIQDDKVRERIVQLPNGRQRLAYSPDDAKEVRSMLSTAQPIFSELDKLDALGGAALVPGSPAANKAQAIRANLIPMLNENAGLKRLSAEDIKNLKQTLNDPSSFSQLLGGRARSNVLRDLLSEKMQAAFQSRLEGGAGGAPSGSPGGYAKHGFNPVNPKTRVAKK